MSFWKRLMGTFGDEAADVAAVRIDASTHMIIGITDAHHHIHDGESFVVSDVQNVSSTTMKWMITTPNTTKWGHMLFDIECTGEVLVLITEGADRDGTTGLTEINRDRNSATAAGLAVHRGTEAGSTDGAVTIYNRRSGTTGQGAKTLAGGGARGSNEYDLAQNTKYVVAITTYADEYVTLHLDWYEHTARD